MTTVINGKSARRPRGRPPAFDRRAVLAKAAVEFWRRGYEGTSIADLTAAMGIAPQSLYAGFGSKAALYRETLDWYATISVALRPDMLDRPGALDTLGRWLIHQAKWFADPAHPPGCMISTALLGCAVENDPVANAVAAMREATIARIRARLERAKVEGETAADADPAALARLVGAIIQGMSVQARDGATRKELVALARLAATELARYQARRGTLASTGRSRSPPAPSRRRS